MQTCVGMEEPHYVYHCAYNPNLKILLRDFKLSDDISLRFSNSDWSEYPLLQINISVGLRVTGRRTGYQYFMELSALGIAQPLSSNILQFMKALPACAKKGIHSRLRLKS